MTGETPIPGLKVAGPDDLKELLPMQVTMGYDWVGYLNRRVLDSVRQGWKGRLTHLKFIPDPENGLVYLMAARAGEYGATRLDYTSAEHGAMLSLYIPLLRFGLEREEGRQRIFSVDLQKVNGGAMYLALNVRSSETAPVKNRRGESPASNQVAASHSGPGTE